MFRLKSQIFNGKNDNIQIKTYYFFTIHIFNCFLLYNCKLLDYF